MYHSDGLPILRNRSMVLSSVQASQFLSLRMLWGHLRPGVKMCGGHMVDIDIEIYKDKASSCSMELPSFMLITNHVQNTATMLLLILCLAHPPQQRPVA